MTQSNRLTQIISDYCFFEGECFDCYEEFHTKLELHSAKDLVYYWRRDSRTIEGATYKTSRPIAPALRYYSVRYSCIFGGQKFKPKSRGSKKVRRSIRNDCPAFISLRATKCGRKLIVTSVSNIHNHEVSAEVNKNLSHYKKLSCDMKEKVMELLFYKVNKKLIREYVRLTDGKELSSKDLCNLMTPLKRNARIADTSYDMNKTNNLTSELIKFIIDHGGTVDAKSFEKAPVVYNADWIGLEKKILVEREMDEVDEKEQEATSNDSFDDQKSDGSHEYVIEILDQTSSDGEVSSMLKTSTPRKRPRWRTPCCFTCSSNNRVVQAQLQVLRARRDKIREGIELLRLRKQKLRLEIQALKRQHKVSSNTIV